MLTVNPHFAALPPRQFSQDECSGAFGTTEYGHTCMTGVGKLARSQDNVKLGQP